jgi:prolyl oligopeptidase
MRNVWTAFVSAVVIAGCSSSSKVGGPRVGGDEVRASDEPVRGPAIAPPAVARVEDLVETLHGREVRDPYRWMEAGGAEMEAYLDDQDRFARATLAAIPGRDELRDAIHDANRGVTRVDLIGVTGAGDTLRVFLYKRAPDEDTAQIWVRDGWGGADRLVVDPRTRDHDGVHHTIDYAAPSPDGRHLAYGISASGSEDSVIEILAVDRGEVLPETIDRAQYASLDWRDDTSFFYWRRAAPAPGATRADWFKNSATYLHVLGQDPAKAAPLLGPFRPDLGLAVESFTWIDPSPSSPWILAGSSPGTSADLEYFVVAKSKLVPGKKIPWRRLSGPTDNVTSMEAFGDRIYALTYAGATRYRIRVFDAAKGTLATARDFVPESEAVIEGFSVGQDAMYVQLLDGGRSRVQRVSWDGKRRDDVPLPFEGAVFATAYPDRVGCFLVGSAWTRARETFAYEPATGVRPLALVEPWPIDYAHVVAEEVEVSSADGTRVPLSIVRRKDLALDGSAPALVEGYAAYGSVARPAFRPITLTWVDRGGVFASCHGRGSGDRGKPWHLDGIKGKKENGVDDFIACAEYLVAHGYTTAARLSVTGTSAGGILAGGAITKRPAPVRRGAAARAGAQPRALRGHRGRPRQRPRARHRRRPDRLRRPAGVRSVPPDHRRRVVPRHPHHRRSPRRARAGVAAGQVRRADAGRVARRQAGAAARRVGRGPRPRLDPQPDRGRVGGSVRVRARPERPPCGEVKIRSTGSFARGRRARAPRRARTSRGGTSRSRPSARNPCRRETCISSRHEPHHHPHHRSPRPGPRRRRPLLAWTVGGSSAAEDPPYGVVRAWQLPHWCSVCAMSGGSLVGSASAYSAARSPSVARRSASTVR